MTINETITAIPQELIRDINLLIYVLEAVGGFIILYIIFNIISLYGNRKKRKEIEQINNNLEEIKSILKSRK
ncbi:MAG: hypothetical protein AABW81_01445 [Nanoarchaeota archaeon]